MNHISYPESSRFNINQKLLAIFSRVENEIDKTEIVEKSRKKTLAISHTVYPK